MKFCPLCDQLAPPQDKYCKRCSIELRELTPIRRAPRRPLRLQLAALLTPLGMLSILLLTLVSISAAVFFLTLRGAG